MTKPPAKTTQTRPSLSDRLEAENLPAGSEAKAYVFTLGKAALEAAFEAIPGGSILTKIFGAADEAAKQAQDERMGQVLERYLNETDDLTQKAAELKAFVTDPWGAMLFKRLKGIVDRTPPDPRLLEAMRDALENMTTSDFRAQFEDHDFALALMEEISPQGMIILRQYGAAPLFRTTSGASFLNGELMGDWSGFLVPNFTDQLSLDTDTLQNRFKMVHADLIRKGFVKALSAGTPGVLELKPSLTAAGQVAANYLSKSTRQEHACKQPVNTPSNSDKTSGMTLIL
ncbi:hypothetical protein D3C72_478200 [compost metagenome]